MKFNTSRASVKKNNSEQILAGNNSGNLSPFLAIPQHETTKSIYPFQNHFFQIAIKDQQFANNYVNYSVNSQINSNNRINGNLMRDLSNINISPNTSTPNSSSVYKYYIDTMTNLNSLCKHVEFDKFGKHNGKFCWVDIHSKIIFK